MYPLDKCNFAPSECGVHRAPEPLEQRLRLRSRGIVPYYGPKFGYRGSAFNLVYVNNVVGLGCVNKESYLLCMHSRCQKTRSTRGIASATRWLRRDSVFPKANLKWEGGEWEGSRVEH